MLLVSLWFETLILYANVFTHKLQTSKIGTYAKGLSSGEVISAFVVGYMFYRALLVVYYIYFHPLSKFSGPKVAAVSGLYVFWYEIVKDGILTRHAFHELRPKYGPVIRIAPNNLYFSSPAAYHQIHAVGQTFRKSARMYAHLGIGDMVPGIIDPARAKNRRQALSRMMSRPVIAKWNEVVKEKLDKLSIRIEQHVGNSEEVVIMQNVISAFIADVVMQFAMVESLNVVDTSDLTHPVVELLHKGTGGLLFVRNFPILLKVSHLPLCMVKYIVPLLHSIHHLEERLKERIERLKAEAVSDKPSKSNTLKSIYTEVSTRYEENGYPELLSGDLAALFTAGLTTTFWVLSTAMYYLAAQPATQEKLFRELQSVWHDPKADIPNWEILEKMPYLTGVVKEALRLGYGVVGSLWRESPPGGSVIDGIYVPGGTVLETDAYSMHMNPDVFDSPESFRPERWLEESKTRIEMERNLVAFGGGSRLCLGIHLAYLELYSGIACFVRRFEIGLTKELREEGWLWTERWIPVKKGANIEFAMKKRLE